MTILYSNNENHCYHTHSIYTRWSRLHFFAVLSCVNGPALTINLNMCTIFFILTWNLHINCRKLSDFIHFICTVLQCKMDSGFAVANSRYLVFVPLHEMSKSHLTKEKIGPGVMKTKYYMVGWYSIMNLSHNINTPNRNSVVCYGRRGGIVIQGYMIPLARHTGLYDSTSPTHRAIRFHWPDTQG